jgi:hypothetical protein
MTNEAFWSMFLDAKISGESLKQMGYDLFFARHAPTGGAVEAVAALARLLGIEPAYMWAAMNTDPGRRVLEQLAWDYQHHTPLPDANQMTRGYVASVARRVTIVRKAAEERRRQPPAPGGKAGAADVKPQAAKVPVKTLTPSGAKTPMAALDASLPPPEPGPSIVARILSALIGFTFAGGIAYEMRHSLRARGRGGSLAGAS